MQPRRRKHGTQRASADGALSDSDHSFCSAHSSAPIRRCLSPEPRSVRPEALAYLQGLLATPEGTERVLRACASACLLPANLAGTDSNLAHSASSALPASRPLTQSSPTSRTTQPRHPPDRRQPPATVRQQGAPPLPAEHSSPVSQPRQICQIRQPPSAQPDSPTATPQVEHSAPSSNAHASQPRSYRDATATTSPPSSVSPSALPHLPRCLHSREPVPVRTLSVSGTTGVTSASCSLGRAARAMQVGVTFRCSA